MTASHGLRLANLVSIATHWRHALRALAMEPPGPGSRGDAARGSPGVAGPWLADGSVDMASVRATLARHVAAVDRIAHDAGASPATLPTQSRHAYAWLRFLVQPGNVERHVATLADLVDLVDLAYPADSADPPVLADFAARSAARPARPARPPIAIDLYFIAPMYRLHRTRTTTDMVVGEMFVGAPRAILSTLVDVAGGKARDGSVGVLRAYAATDAARAVVDALQVGDPRTDGPVRGRHRDLVEVFDSVNRRHFGSGLDQPRLRWSGTRTKRRMGHYQPAGDVVTLSATLDDPHVPVYVVEFVMYHELLHRVLGVPVVNGRVRAHTPEFRRREAAHPDYERTQRWLATRP